MKVGGLFHLTTRTYLDSIMRNGLFPSFAKGISCWKEWDRIFLTDDVNTPIQHLGHIYNEEEWVVLKIDTKGLRIEQHTTTCFPEGENRKIKGEFITMNNIPPKNISEYIK